MKNQVVYFYTEEQVRTLLRTLLVAPGTNRQPDSGEQTAGIRDVELSYDAPAASVRVKLTLKHGQEEHQVPLAQPHLCQPNYREEVLRTYRGEDTWVDKLTLRALGLAGEAGEVVDAIKKWSFQGHLLDQEALLLELGDVPWCLVLVGSVFGWSLEQLVAANVVKLRKRYPDGFETARSSSREEAG
jgi:NTP pyrophosphatase (non-canonical NTP hydrolase)